MRSRSFADPLGICSHVGGSLEAKTKVYAGFTFSTSFPPHPRNGKGSLLFLLLKLPFDQGLRVTSFPNATRAPWRKSSPAEWSFSPRLSTW